MIRYSIFAVVVLLMLTVGVVFYFYSLLTPVSRQQQETVRFVVPRGQAISVIGNRLEEAGLIKSALAFRVVVEMNNLAHDIQAGSFDISPSLSTSEIAKHLTTGTQDTWITIIEGWRSEEIAESLTEQDLDQFDPELFLELAAESEGMLYPDTYLIPREMTTENIYSLLLNTFERKVIQGLADEIAASDREFSDVLVMASLVEREARGFEQMRLVAGILWNRIEIGMPLQVDATLQYITGYDRVQQGWWTPPTAQQKQIESPYNTYLNTGLPPQPIANPSVDAIRATLLPQETDALFYIHANDGTIYTAETLDEHNANVNQYLR